MDLDSLNNNIFEYQEMCSEIIDEMNMGEIKQNAAFKLLGRVNNLAMGTFNQIIRIRQEQGLNVDGVIAQKDAFSKALEDVKLRNAESIPQEEINNSRAASL